MYYRRLVTFGCSCTAGEGLETPTTQSWPSILSSLLNLNLLNLAVSGYSNTAIKNSILEHVKNLKDSDLVIVNWTFISRLCYFTNTFNHVGRWTLERNDINKEMIDIFSAIVLNLHSDVNLQHSMFDDAIFVQTLLKNRNIHVYYDFLEFDDGIKEDNSVSFLRGKLLKNSVFEMNFTERLNSDVSRRGKANDGLHPSALAHSEYASTLFNYLKVNNEIIKNS